MKKKMPTQVPPQKDPSQLTEGQASEILKLQNQICFPLYAASRLMTQSYGEDLAKLQITYPQYLVLIVLWEKDGMSVTELGEKLFLDSGTLTPILKKMAILNLIKRKRSPTDDRCVLNFLTPKAQRLKAQAAKMSFGLFCRSGLQPEAAAALRETLNSLLQVLIPLSQAHK